MIRLPVKVKSIFALGLLSAFSGFFFSARVYSMDKLKIALAQVRCVDSDLEGNFARIEQMTARAVSQGAVMVLFPETVDLGWVNPEAYSLAGPVPGPFSRRLSELAKRHAIWLGIGLCEKQGDKLYDTAVLIDPQGEIVLKHRKINLLSWLMDPPYTPGRAADIKAVDTPLGRVGILICADSFEPELLEAMALQRPGLVYIPYGWAYQREGWPEHGFQLVKTVQQAARAIGAPVLGPNLVGEITHGEWKGRTFEGLSTAADAAGMSLVQGRWNREDLVMVEIEPVCPAR
ncbi:MAG: carbon-nitrogen hydrolase family protein [Candidatus Glassbacteria bacterium]|nr:carbon-nitrogen hydrolase family protein [Candidatus Glassbacteria bacterium]